MLNEVRYMLTDFGYRVGWAAARYVPESIIRSIFDVSCIMASRQSGGPPQLRRNLGRVLGISPMEVPDVLVAESMCSYARYWQEAFRLPMEDPARIVADTEISDADVALVDESFESGRGVIYALPHSGNWDTCGVWLVNRCGSFCTVAERLKPESLFDRFVEYRKSLGFDVIPLTGGEQPPFRVLEERLRGGGIVCLMGDRDLSIHGVPVTFFGERTRMPTGPARLAQVTGAVLIAAHHYFTGPRTSRIRLTPIEVDATDSVEQITQRLADSYQSYIASAPVDWHMFQPLWEADWSSERRARLEDQV